MKILVLFFLLTSCTSTQSAIQMENRTYDMCVDDKDRPTCNGYCYQSNVCVKKILGICVNKEIKVVDMIPVKFEDRAKCEQLFNMNFVLKVRAKPI